MQQLRQPQDLTPAGRRQGKREEWEEGDGRALGGSLVFVALKPTVRLCVLKRPGSEDEEAVWQMCWKNSFFKSGIAELQNWSLSRWLG